MKVVRYGNIFSIVVILLLTAVIQGESQYISFPGPTTDVTRLPYGPFVEGVDGTAVSKNSSSNFTVNYQLAQAGNTNCPGDPTWDAAMVYWLPWPTNTSGYDLTGITNFVFAVKGTPNRLTVEFQSTVSTNSASLRLITNSWQYYHIPASAITNLSSMKAIAFTVNYDNVGGVKTGSFDVIVQSFTNIPPSPVIIVDPSLPTGEVTRLPYRPSVSEVDGTEVAQYSASNFVMNYKLAPLGSVTNGPSWHGSPDWDTAMVYWQDFGLKDLSSISTFVFAVRGTATTVKVEFQSATNAVATNYYVTVVALQRVTNTWQHYYIAASNIAHLTWLRTISFVTDWDSVGTSKTGMVEVVVRGLDYDPHYNGSPIGTPTVLPNTPAVMKVGGANPLTVVQSTNSSNIDVTYDVNEGWAGATILYSMLGTNGSQNLSAYNPLVFGLSGNAKKVKIEFVDAFAYSNLYNPVKQYDPFIVICTNVGSSVQYYSIDTTGFNDTNNSKRANITNICMINFVVDEGLAGAGNEAGQFHIVSGGLKLDWFVGPSNTGPATILTNLPSVVPVGGASNTIVLNTNSSLIDVQYDFFDVVGTWSGATILYDDYGTASTKESQDFSKYTNIVFGLWCEYPPIKVKVEFIDSLNRTATAYCTNVGSSVQYYWFSTARIDSEIDITQISAINFVVDANLVADSGEPAGSFHIESGGLNVRYPDIYPTSSGTLTLLPPTPVDVTLVGGAAPNSRVDQYSSSHFRAYYRLTTTTNWAGASILYDNFGTAPTPIEFGDFSGLASVVFGVQGYLNSLSIEFIDSSNKVVSTRFLNIATNLQYYTVDVGTLSSLGLRVDRVQMINFVVNSNLVGAANMSGHFDVFIAGLTNAPKYYPQTDLTGGGLPDSWKEKYGLNPHDDGSTDPNNGPLGDPDGDGVNNSDEYVAGTSPIDFDSTPRLNITRLSKTNLLLSIDGFVRREYRFYRNDVLRTGTWTRVGPFKFVSSESELAQYSEDLSTFTSKFYRCRIGLADVTRIAGQPDVVIVGGGGDGNTIISQPSSSEFTANYNVRDGWAGVTITFDDYGTTTNVETRDLSGYAELTFAISGTPQKVKFEIESKSSAATNKGVGYFQYVTNKWNFYTIDLRLLTNVIDITHISGISFVVDEVLAGNEIGSFSVRTWGLSYEINTSGLTNGVVTVLQPTSPTVGNLGGAQSTNAWRQIGVTNIFVPYNVGASTTSWDGVSISYAVAADYSSVTSVTFGVKGTPQNVKIEFKDAATTNVNAYLHSITNSLRYYTVNMSDLEAAGLNPEQVRYINFVVDRGLAGVGKYTGDFTVVTAGLAPTNSP